MQAISDSICDLGSGCGNITVNIGVYNLEAVHAATCQFTDNYHIFVTPKADNWVTIIFEAKGEAGDVREDMKDFANALVGADVSESRPVTASG